MTSLTRKPPLVDSASRQHPPAHQTVSIAPDWKDPRRKIDDMALVPFEAIDF